MSDLDLDLSSQIDALKERRKELLGMRVSPPGPSADDKRIQRQVIDEKVIILLEKVTVLERIKDDRQSARIAVRGLTDQEKMDVEQAMARLGRVVEKEQTFEALLNAINGLFRAADTLATTAQRP
jgi:hypothetical protein